MIYLLTEPSTIIPMLIPKIYSQNVKIRSAADAALVNLLVNHVDPQATLFTLIESLITYAKEPEDFSEKNTPSAFFEQKSQPKVCFFKQLHHSKALPES